MQAAQREEVPRIAGHIALDIGDVIGRQTHTLELLQKEPVQPPMVLPAKGSKIIKVVPLLPNPSFVAIVEPTTIEEVKGHLSIAGVLQDIARKLRRDGIDEFLCAVIPAAKVGPIEAEADRVFLPMAVHCRTILESQKERTPMSSSLSNSDLLKSSSDPSSLKRS